MPKAASPRAIPGFAINNFHKMSANIATTYGVLCPRIVRLTTYLGIVSVVRESRCAGRSTQEPTDSVVRKIHPSKFADVMLRMLLRLRHDVVMIGRAAVVPLPETWQHLCFGPDIAADYSDHGENRDPGQQQPLTKETRLENTSRTRGAGGVDTCHSSRFFSASYCV
jgi:hypothetical protein